MFSANGRHLDRLNITKPNKRHAGVGAAELLLSLS